MFNRLPKSKSAPRAENNSCSTPHPHQTHPQNHQNKHNSYQPRNNQQYHNNINYKSERIEDKFVGVLKYTRNPYGEEQYKKMVNFIGIRVIPIGQPCLIHIYKKTVFFYKYNTTTSFLSFYISTLDIQDNTTMIATMIDENKCCIHDLIYTSGKYQESTVKRLEILLSVLKNNIAILNAETNVIFGMCYLFDTWQEFIKKKELIYYNFSVIEYITNNRVGNKNTRFLYKFKSGNTLQTEPVINVKQFFVKADLQYDVYYLYESTNKTDTYEMADIPNYKTSVMMNNIFRKIKENADLDLLEESDEEEEFEDCRLDKYVDLDKTVLMTCEYNCTNKKWIPKKIEC